VNAAELARRGAELARGRRHAAAQLPPVGPPPAAELLMVGALLWPRPGLDPGPVLALVADDDVADPALAQLLGVIRSMVYAHESLGPAIVLDELTRSDGAGGPVADRLLQATTCGAVPDAVRGYAAAVVAASLRRRVESAGNALTEAAAQLHEDELAPLAQRAAAAVVDCAARLERLRGER
jgi:hypothetical protein